MSDPCCSYDVLYTKDGNKKRKTYHDGTLTSTKKISGYTVVLKDDSQKEIFRKNLSVAKYDCGTEIKLGAFDVMIEKENSTLESPAESTQKEITPPLKLSHNTKADVPRKILKTLPSIITSNIQKSKNHAASQRPIALDESLLRLMRPHQIEGAHFILGCLGRNIDTASLDHIDFVDDDFMLPSVSVQVAGPHQHFRGAILADEMGVYSK